MTASDAKLPNARACLSMSNRASPFVAMVGLLVLARNEHAVAPPHQRDDGRAMIRRAAPDVALLDPTAQRRQRQVEQGRDPQQDHELSGPHRGILAAAARAVNWGRSVLARAGRPG